MCVGGWPLRTHLILKPMGGSLSSEQACLNARSLNGISSGFRENIFTFVTYPLHFWHD